MCAVSKIVSVDYRDIFVFFPYFSLCDNVFPELQIALAKKLLPKRVCLPGLSCESTFLIKLVPVPSVGLRLSAPYEIIHR